MQCDELLFSEDEDAENYSEQIRGLQLPLKTEPSNSLNDDLFNRMLSDKQKPIPDILVSLHSQNSDPYAEIDEIDRNAPKYKWRSPQKGFEFFRTQHNSVSKTAASPTSRAQTTPMSAVRRRRLLQKTTPVLKPLDEEEDEYIPLSAKRRRLESEAEEESPNRTTRVLRPRKSEWLPEDLIPLSALRDSLLYHKREKEQKTLEEKITKSTPKRASTAIVTTPKSRRRRSGGQRKLFVKEAKKQRKRKTCFSSDSSDDGLFISTAKRTRKTVTTAAERGMDSDSDDDLPLVPRKPSSKL